MKKPIVNYYKKKPVQIAAAQFTNNNEVGSSQMDSIIAWVNTNSADPIARHDGTDIYIKTLEGEMRASCGDYIIQGIKGEFYPCKPDIFAASYDINHGGLESSGFEIESIS